MSQRSLRAKKKIVMKKAIKERDKRINQIREQIIEKERKENETQWGIVSGKKAFHSKKSLQPDSGVCL